MSVRIMTKLWSWLWLVCIAVITLPSPATAQTFKYCTVSGSDADLGSHSSLELASGTQESGGAGGLTCEPPLALLSTSYIKVKVESSTFQLTGGPDNQTIPFTISATENGTAIPAGAEFDFTSFQLLNLFSGPGGSLPLYVKTQAQPGLRAGIYSGTVNLRWYFSVCTLGLLVICDFSESPGFVRPILFTPLNWGSGVLTTMSVTMIVENDCAIAAPDLDFGSAPLAGSFAEAAGTINIRCSAGASYSVGLSDGNNFDGGWRRMRRAATNDYLRYEIYQAPSSGTRWGGNGSERLSSASAQVNPDIYDGITQQGFTYGARIDPAQTTPPVGQYVDTIVLDIQF
jgi:spore coat protein U-like protein